MRSNCEFGRTPTSEGVDKPGRDHNWHGFSMWLAGAGVKGGQAVGATDELGFLAVETVPTSAICMPPSCI
jgi:uncharacterized protein (DUF1501 family)